MKARILVSILALSLLGGAAPPPPAYTPIVGFHHDAGVDLYGYYMPAPEVRLGKWQLTDISVGPLDEFVAYENGKRDPPEYAPIMFEFADATSPMVQTEIGEVHKVTRRVLPTAYRLSGGHLSFAGTDAVLGRVTFEGTLDIATIRRAQNQDGGNEGAIVLSGPSRRGRQDDAHHLHLVWRRLNDARFQSRLCRHSDARDRRTAKRGRAQAVPP